MDEPKYEGEIIAILSQKRWPPLDEDTKPMPVVRDDVPDWTWITVLVLGGMLAGFLLCLLLT
jgi:hypothetical protein